LEGILAESFLSNTDDFWCTDWHRLFTRIFYYYLL